MVGAAPFTPRGDGSTGLDSAHDRDYSPDAILADGERWRGAGYTIEAIATPGHCSNHLCFALLEENALFSGDHVMGWSTSIVAPPDGSMRAYMDSLDKMRGRPETIYWPGHGGPVVEPQRYVRALIHHRRQREVSILNTLANGPQTIPALVARIYVGLNPVLDACRWPFDPCPSRGFERARNGGWRSACRRRAALPSRLERARFWIEAAERDGSNDNLLQKIRNLVKLAP